MMFLRLSGGASSGGLVERGRLFGDSSPMNNDSSKWMSNRDISSTLDFWFGPDYFLAKKEGEKRAIDSSSYVESRSPMWWGGGEEIDRKAKAFRQLIVSVGENKHKQNDDAWDTRQGFLAAIVLLDQLSRNAFRGEPQAFKYDSRAIDLALEAHRKGLTSSYCYAELQFATMPLMHSEELEHHELFQQIWEQAKPNFADGMQGFVRYTLEFAKSHMDVIKRFGRYPHRNKLHNRDSTQEEVEWLNSDEVPGWAKSQG